MPTPTVEELLKRIEVLEQADQERQRIEASLRESEEKYRTLTENIAVGIFRSTPGPTGRFLEANSALVRMLGYPSRDELLAVEVSQIYVDPTVRRFFSEKLSHQGFLKNEELVFRRRDGTPIIVSETAIAVRDADGNLQYFDGIVEDITERKRTEEEVRLQRAYLEQLFNSAPEAIVWHDNHDRVVNVNEEFTRLFGYTRAEAVGHQINELVAPTQFQDEASTLSEQVTHGQRVERDSQRRRRDGTLIDVSILGAPIMDGDEQKGVFAIYRDIRERKRAEEELRLQKTYLERLFNSAPEAIALNDMNDRIVSVNAEFTRMFGYTQEEAAGFILRDLIVPASKRDEAMHVSERINRGERIEFDSKRQRKDGQLLDVSILGAPIIHGGTQIGDYAIYRDITERKKAEEELRLQKTYVERLFNSAPEAIVWHDQNDRVLNVNDEFSRLFGYSREEAIGQFINDLVAPPELRGEAGLYSSQVIHGARVEAESQRRRKDGSLVDVSILGAPIIDADGRQVGVFAIYRDITERKKAEEARIRLREEARMARNIQMNLLPNANPELPGYDIIGQNLPAQSVGGDYYDFIPLDDRRLAIAVGDVSGKGLAASMVMANLQATIRGQAFFDAEPQQCLERANSLLFQSTDARTFVSLFYCILDIRRHVLTYANAGQDFPLLWSPGKQPVPLSTHGIALGVKENVFYEKREITLRPGDRLLIYTDGLSEAMNEQMQEFGEEALRNLLQRAKADTSAAIMESILTAVRSHVGTAPPSDDMTLVIVNRTM